MDSDKRFYEIAKYGSIGISWVLTSSIYFYLGYNGGTYLDRRFGTDPVFLIAGLLGGVLLSMVSLIKEIVAISSGIDKMRGKLGDSARDREKSNRLPKESGESDRKGRR